MKPYLLGLILTVESNIPLSITNGIFRDALVASDVDFAEPADEQSHLDAVVGAVDLGHLVLFARDDHFAWNKSAQNYAY